MTQQFITIATMRPLRRGKKGMGLNSSDEIYVANGHYPLVDNIPTYDINTQTISHIDEVDEVNKVVNRVYTVIDIPLEELIAKKILEGENYIKTTVKGVVDAFNSKYGVAFDSIYNMAIYKDDVDYPLSTQCNTLIKWQNSMWVTARTNQASVLAGTMTDAEFLALLPVAPVV